ncbi:MAG: nucleotidyltransferase family protein [Candidatus Omnitrophica bacterium]|nr:nucleotidyltransferase family protein [Candidatus Omnitrophota bacterium]
MIFYEEILRVFQKQKVKYVLIGGIAVNLLGSMRSTADMDILVEMSDDNLKKIVGILQGQGYKVKQPVNPMNIADKIIRENWIKSKHMKAFNFYQKDEFKEVDIIIDSPVSFQKARENVVWVRIDNLRLPVISIDNLIKMKQKAGRLVDKLDIEELKKIKKLKGKL